MGNICARLSKTFKSKKDTTKTTTSVTGMGTSDLAGTSKTASSEPKEKRRGLKEKLIITPSGTFIGKDGKMLKSSDHSNQTTTKSTRSKRKLGVSVTVTEESTEEKRGDRKNLKVPGDRKTLKVPAKRASKKLLTEPSKKAAKGKKTAAKVPIKKVKSGHKIKKAERKGKKVLPVQGVQKSTISAKLLSVQSFRTPRSPSNRSVRKSNRSESGRSLRKGETTAKSKRSERSRKSRREKQKEKEDKKWSRKRKLNSKTAIKPEDFEEATVTARSVTLEDEFLIPPGEGGFPNLFLAGIVDNLLGNSGSSAGSDDEVQSENLLAPLRAQDKSWLYEPDDIETIHLTVPIEKGTKSWATTTTTLTPTDRSAQEGQIHIIAEKIMKGKGLAKVGAKGTGINPPPTKVLSKTKLNQSPSKGSLKMQTSTPASETKLAGSPNLKLQASPAVRTNVKAASK